MTISVYVRYYGSVSSVTNCREQIVTVSAGDTLEQLWQIIESLYGRDQLLQVSVFHDGNVVPRQRFEQIHFDEDSSIKILPPIVGG